MQTLLQVIDWLASALGGIQSSQYVSASKALCLRCVSISGATPP